MKIRKKPLLLLMLAFVLILGVLVVFGERGILQRLHLQRELGRIKAANVKMAEENRKLKEEVRRLQTERKYIEEIARKELGMVKEGEMIYQFDTTGRNKEKSK
jgi:cell division protein FtsB